MTKQARGIFLLVGLAVVALLAAGVVGILSFGRTPSPAVLPNPNGYDDFIQAGQLINGRPDDIADADHEGLRALVVTNGDALRRIRVGLTRDCAAPTAATIANFAGAAGNWMTLKSLAKLLVADGRVAELENRPADAARSYIEAIRLGTEMSRGGLIIDRLVGIACEAMGSIRLVKLLPRLTCEQMLPLVAELERIDARTVDWQTVMGNENCFVRSQLGKYPNPLKLASDLWQGRTARKAAAERHASAVAHRRLLMTELALRCYRCEHGTAPGNLGQLIPKLIQRVPSDPFSRRPIVYRVDGTNWVLYSLGSDGRDDGGKAVDRSVGATKSGKGNSPGDLLYDSRW